MKVCQACEQIIINTEISTLSNIEEFSDLYSNMYLNRTYECPNQDSPCTYEDRLKLAIQLAPRVLKQLQEAVEENFGSMTE